MFTAMPFVFIRTVKQVEFGFGALLNRDACVIRAIPHRYETQHTHTAPRRLEPHVPEWFLVSTSKIYQ